LRRGEYAGWHGTLPMRQLLDRMTPDACIVEGRGPRVRDAAGRWFLDARSGLWNVTLGYDHPVLVDAVRRQLETLPYACLTRDDRPAAISLQFADELAAVLPEGLRRVRFGTTGSQMVEASVLLSRCVRVAEGTPERTDLIALDRAYHGSGPGAWSLTDAPRNHVLCGPLLPGVHHVACPADEGTDAALAALEAELDKIGPERVSAVVVEPIQGDRVVTPEPGYLRRLRDLTRMHGIHLIVDEVATGMGRTGAISLAAEMGVLPDMLVLGKGLTSGYVPASALVVSEPIYDLLYDPPQVQHDPDAAPIVFGHGSTADGGPLAMAAGLAVLEVLTEGGLLEHVRRVGSRLGERLRDLADSIDGVVATGGAGLMQGVRLIDPHRSPRPLPEMQVLRDECADRGLLITTLGDRIVLVPPLVVTDRDCDEIVEILHAAIPCALRDRSTTIHRV
jgi:adenosylmethionine-8-amino-7-oxononanoate aminotransferase